MRAEVLEACRPDGIAVMACNDERGQFHNISRFEPVRIQVNDDVGKDLICLFLDGGRRRTIRSHTDLPRQEDELCAFGHRRRVTVKAKWRVDAYRV